jgi:tetratricopeptide (TPR) repeat protein
MMNRFVCALLVGLSLLVSCNRDPEAAKRKYVESGNKYFEKGKYKEALIMYRNALKRDLKYGEAYYRSALAELKLQRFVDAARSLQRSVELQPENADAHNRLTNLYLNAYMADRRRPRHLLTELKTMADRYSKRFPGSYEEARLKGYLALFEKDIPGALGFFQKANQIKPYQQDLVLIYTQTLVANKQPEEAEKLAYEMIDKNPKALPLYDALVLLYGRQNRPADMERVLKSKLENNPKTAEAYLQLAAHYHSTKQREPMMSVLQRLSSNTADFPKGALLVGDFFLRTADYEQAARSYQAGMQQKPEEKAAYQKRMVEVLLKQNKKPEAVKLVNDMVGANPKDDEAIAMRASLSLMAGTKEELQAAINDLQSVISRKPDNPVLRYNLGRALMARQNPQAAKVQFEEAAKLRPDYLPPRIALAEMALQNREYGKVSQMAQEILYYDPQNLPARLLRSRALIGTGDVKQARAELASTTEKYPELPEARLQMAALDLQERNFKSAEESFRRLHQQSKDPRAFLGLVDSYVGQGQSATAVKLLREEIARNPNVLDYHVALGNIGMTSGDYQMAIAEYKTVVSRNEKNAGVWLLLSEAYRKVNDVPQAIAATKKATEVAPNFTNANLQLALLYDTTGQKQQAKPLYEQVLRTQPDNPIALNNLAFMLAESGNDLDQALTMAQRARQRVPNDLNVADTLGYIYIKKNLPDSAIPIYRELIQKQPSRPTFRYHLAMALMQKGDKASAKRECQAALQQKPDRGEETQIRELMAKLG